MAEKTIPDLTDNPGLTGAALVEVSQNGSSYKATVDEWNALLAADVDTAAAAAQAAQTAAETAQAAAETAQAGAESAQTDALASSGNAASSASLALTRANAAATSATAAAASATAAATSATNAATSATAAASSATSASTSATSASNSATSASSSATSASSSASAASTSATNAATSATAASTSATAAATSATAAAASAATAATAGGTVLASTTSWATAFNQTSKFVWTGTNLTPTSDYTLGSNGSAFKGWGNKYSRPSTITFNAIRIPALTRNISVSTDKWSTINVQVRSCSAGGDGNIGSILATGSLAVDPESGTLTDLVILLNTPMTEAQLSSVFFVGFYAANSSGAAATSASVTTTALTYFEGNSFYTTNLGVSWQNNSGDGKIAIELLNVTDSGIAPSPTSIKEAMLPVVAADMVLPANSYAVVGREFNIYNANLFLNHADWNIDYTITSGTTIGYQQNERWTVVPATAATPTLTVTAYDRISGSSKNAVATTLKIAASSAAFTRKALFIGDSTTAAGTYTGELIVLDTADAATALTLIGTKGSGSNKHEGQGGWTVGRYYQPGATYYASNPFANPPNSSGIFDFAYYLSNTGQTMASGDWVFFHLGINDVFNETTDAAVETKLTAMMAQMELMITNIQTAVSGIRIGIMVTIPPSATQDAAGTGYGSGQNRWRYFRNWFMLAKRWLSQFDGRTGSNIYLVPVHLSLDTANNMSFNGAAPVNSRSSTNVTRQSDLVHPASSGYYQMADAIWAFLKYNG